NAFPTVLQSPINAGAFCMLAGLIIVPLVSLITPKMNKEKMENVFACYEEKVTVLAKDAIGEKVE
ncbi:MAG: sodium:solute symporter, partial [Clostridia bacterium]|nr:sodium:solute symporter [Clostridia bacterium]